MSETCKMRLRKPTKIGITLIVPKHKGNLFVVVRELLEYVASPKRSTAYERTRFADQHRPKNAECTIAGFAKKTT